MVVEALRSFECGIVSKDGVKVKDVSYQEGDTFNIVGLLYEDNSDTYDFEFADGCKIECLPGSWVRV